MNRNKLLILVAALAIVALVALLSRPTASGLGEGDLLLPELNARLNGVSGLVVKRGGDQTVASLRRTDDGWIVSDHAGYRANFERIRQNLVGLAEARIFEAKTSNPEFYERLGVRDISDPLATGHEFHITGEGIDTRIIVGQTNQGGGKMAYVRPAGQAQSYLVTASLDPGREPVDWLDNAIMDIPSARVRAVQIQHPDGEILAIAKARSDSVNYTVADVPEGRSLSFDGVANSIGAALAALSFDEVIAAADLDLGSIAPTVAVFETFDGLRVTVTTWELGDRGRYAAFTAEASAAPGAEDSPRDEETLAGIADEAATINQRLDGWAYRLPSFKSEQFVQRMDDLLAAPE